MGEALHRIKTSIVPRAANEDLVPKTEIDFRVDVTPRIEPLKVTPMAETPFSLDESEQATIDRILSGSTLELKSDAEPEPDRNNTINLQAETIQRIETNDYLANISLVRDRYGNPQDKPTGGKVNGNLDNAIIVPTGLESSKVQPGTLDRGVKYFDAANQRRAQSIGQRVRGWFGR